MQLTDLTLLPDLPYLFVFGPGFGESIVVRVPPDEGWRGSQDASFVLDTGTVASLLNRIDHIWINDPPSKWMLVEGATRTVGEATIEVLSPPANSQPRKGNLNRLSSAMLVRWHECQILLGADLSVPGWRAVAKGVPPATGLATSQALKVAHHGSKSAQHATAIGVPPPRDRACFATPFNRGRQLPSYADDHGVDLLLRTHLAVGVTAAPAHARGTSTPRRKMQPQREQFGALTLTHELTKAAPTEAWIASAFDRAGARVETWYGDAAGSVVA